MKSTLRLILAAVWLFVLGCKLDELPSDKRLKECVKPAGSITATVDPANYLKYTFSLSNVTGDIENVVWTVNGQSALPIPKNQPYPYTFLQAGNFNVSASLQNGCANNTSLQSSVAVTPVPPAVSTGQVVSAGSASATVQLTVTSLGSTASLTEYGIVYAEAPNNNPTLENAFNKPFTGTPSVNSPVPVTITTNLKPGTRYFYKAYVRYGAGQVVYGTTVGEFTILAAATSKVFLFGGSGFDYGYFMVPIADGGIFAGNTNSNNGDVSNFRGAYDAWVARYDGNGVLLWKRTLGGALDDNLRSVQLTNDGNVIVVGNTNSSDGDLSGKNKGGYDVWVVKLSASDGTILWQNTYGGSSDEFGASVQATSDNGCIFVGRTKSDGGGDINVTTGRKGGFDIWVVKLNSSGGIQWQYAYGGSGDDFGNNVRTTSDGGYVVAGNTNSNDGQVSGLKGETDGWVFKLNSLGTLLWQRPLGTAGADGASSVQPTQDGYIVTGSIAVTGTGKPNVMITKLNLSGVEVGTPLQPGGMANEEGTHIEQAPDGSFIVVAITNSSDGDVSGYKGGESDIWVLKLKSDGRTIEWRKNLIGSGLDQSYCIRPVTDGYWLVGSTNSIVETKNKGATDVLIVKMDLNGDY